MSQGGAARGRSRRSCSRPTTTPRASPGEVFEGIKAAIVADRYAYFDDFLANFYNIDVLAGRRISDAALRASFQVAARASPYATYACVDTWLTDFRGDLPKIDVPVLVVQGDQDHVLPFAKTGQRLPPMLPDARLVTLKGAPHGIPWTHAPEVARATAEFIGAKAMSHA